MTNASQKIPREVPPPGAPCAPESDSPLHHALALAALNWKVFPCWWVIPRDEASPPTDGSPPAAAFACACGDRACTRPGKHPIGRVVPHGLKDATTDAAKIRAWWSRWPAANVAVATGAACGPRGIVVVDVDPQKGGAESLAAVEKEIGQPFARTVTQDTGGGGWHLFYSHPGGVYGNAVDAGGYRGVDLRGDGGYVVVPPSTHASGGTYRWRPGLAPWDVAPDAIPVISEFFLTLISSRRSPERKISALDRAANRLACARAIPIDEALRLIQSGEVRVPGFDAAAATVAGGAGGVGVAAPTGGRPPSSVAPPDPPIRRITIPGMDVVELRARAYVAAMPESISGEGGHAKLWAATLALVRGFALPPDMARRVIDDEFNPRCVPPWSDREIAHKIDDAGRSDVESGYLLERGVASVAVGTGGNGSGNGNGAHRPGGNGAAVVDGADGGNPDAPGTDDPPIPAGRGIFAAAPTEAQRAAVDVVAKPPTSFDGVFSAGFVEAMAVLLVWAPGDYMALKASLRKKYGKSWRETDVERAVRPRAAEIRAVNRTEQNLARFGSPNQWFPEAPLPRSLIMPPGWIVNDHGVVQKADERAGDDGERRTAIKNVCDTPLFVSARMRDLATGDATLRLVWRRRGIWRTLDAGRGAIMSRDVVKLATKDLPVHVANAVDVSEYLSAFEIQNDALIPESTTSSRLGWIEDGRGLAGFLWGSTFLPARADAPAVTFRDDGDAGVAQIVDGYRASGTLDGWKAAVAPLAAHPRAAVMVLASLAAPVLSMVRGANFCADLAWGTSSGKTTALRAAVSAWGDPDERSGGLLRGWNATRTWIERAAALNDGLPIFLDDTKSARRRDDVGAVVYDVAFGRGRGRGTAEGMQASGAWRTVLLSTGEEPITAMTPAGGAKARVLEMHAPPFGATDAATAEIVRAVGAGILRHHGVAGPALARWMIANLDREAWRARWEDHVADWTEMGKGDAVAGRFADYFATLSLTLELCREAGVLPGAFVAEIVEACWSAAAEGAGEADIAAAALAHVVAWAAAREHEFWGRHPSSAIAPPRGWSGSWGPQDGDRLCFVEHVLRGVLTEGGFEWATVRQWRDRGWIDTDSEKGRLTKNGIAIGPGGLRQRMVCVRADARRSAAGSDAGDGTGGGDDGTDADGRATPIRFSNSP